MKNKPATFFLIALSVFIFDQIAKYLVKANVGHFDVIRIMPFLNIVYVENTGSAFGMFKSLGNTFFIIAALSAIIFVSVLIIKDRDNRFVFSLILGGAGGNLADRIIHGSVIDFIDFHIGKYHWYTFNVADSALTISVALLALKTLALHKK